jgi:phosphohistidine phosphatase
MDLILWRHAEAAEAGDGEDDLARPLTAKGERQAHRMAGWLNHVLPATTRILVSPAVRTRFTAQALDRKFKLCAALAPSSGVDELLEAARWPESREPVLVVGHQPQLGMALAHLVGGAEPGSAPSWRIKKAGLWWLRRRDEADGLAVVAVRTPELP